MVVPFTRRMALGAVLALAVSRPSVVAADGVLPAIRWAEATEAAYLALGRTAADWNAAGQPIPAELRADRLAVASLRRLARLDLYALTPATAESAAALVAYHTTRGERPGTTSARRAARRRLREVFARPNAAQPPQARPFILANTEPSLI